MESTVALESRGFWTKNRTGQCRRMNSPSLGTLQVVAGNGTSLGTVMILNCPLLYRPFSGGRITCVQDINGTHWNGGIPECKQLEIPGFYLAVLLSIISVAIIMIMSIYFITSCLLYCLKKEDMEHTVRERNRDNDRFWQQINAEEQRDSFYNHNGRMNNNNNNNSSSGNSRQEQEPRCHQKNYPEPLAIHHSQPTMGQLAPNCLMCNPALDIRH